jgi:hypothetical protein
LASACHRFDDRLINRITFDNCGIDDHEMATIIQACLNLTDFKSIVYKANTFGQESLEKIAPLLERKIPNHLE